MSCIVGPDGAFKTCRILSETPKRFNFGWAALAVAFKYRLKTVRSDGTSTEGEEMTIPIHFIYDSFAQRKAAAWAKAKAR